MSNLQEWLAWATEKTGHYVDWSRTAERLREASSQGFNYTRAQINVRAAMWVCMIGGAAYGAYTSEEDATASNRLLRAGVGFLTMFVITHAVVVGPRIKRTYERKQETKANLEQCWTLFNASTMKSDPAMKAHLTALVLGIQTISLTTKHKGRAAGTVLAQLRASKSLLASFNDSTQSLKDVRLDDLTEKTGSSISDADADRQLGIKAL